jgi:hypothetical protein
MKEIIIGVLASMFFAVTFILNRAMEFAGGSWMWSSSLRFFFIGLFMIIIGILLHSYDTKKTHEQPSASLFVSNEKETSL